MTPWFDPIAISIGPFSIKWYGVAYVVGILMTWGWAYWVTIKQQKKHPHFSYTPQQLENYISWSIFGIVIGGRLGFCLLYHPLYFFNNPLEILQVWEGGMAFHGGLLGVIVATILFTRRNNLSLPRFFDMLALCTPLGLFAGRVANFINGEHYGHPTDLPWGIIFPESGLLPRHPSQLYEAALEGLLLFIALNLIHHYVDAVKKVPGLLAGYFMIGYSIARTIGEVFRVPEAHLDFFPWGLTYGQILSLGQILIGFLWLIYCDKQHTKSLSEK